MAFDGFYYGRITYLNKDLRVVEKRMQYVWHANPSIGADASLFSGTLFSGYGPPSGFCFDRGCSDTPIEVAYISFLRYPPFFENLLKCFFLLRSSVN